MNTTKKAKRTELNMHASPEDFERIKRMRDKHGINLSGLFKVFIIHLEEQLDKLDYDKAIASSIKENKIQ